jgi:hypothetical protein
MLVEEVVVFMLLLMLTLIRGQLLELEALAVAALVE